MLEEKLHRLENELKRNNEVLDILSQNLEKMNQPNVLQIVQPVTQRLPVMYKELPKNIVFGESPFIKLSRNVSRHDKVAKYEECSPQGIITPSVNVKVIMDFQ